MARRRPKYQELIALGQQHLFGSEQAGRVMPSVPDTGWTLPKELPDLRNEKLLGLDIETCDPDLTTKGPGFKRDAFIAGIAVGTKDREWYLPIRHEDRSQCLDPDNVLRWARDNLCQPGQAKIGAHIQYDVEGLRAAGVPVTGPFYDVAVAEPLIDETAFAYDLDTIAGKYLGEQKEAGQMYDWLALAFGGKPTRKEQAKHIWRAPPAVVGPYAMSDVRLPREALEKQLQIVNQQNLSEVWDLETRLIPMLLGMRDRGARVDLDKAKAVSAELQDQLETIKKKLRKVSIEHNKNVTLERYCKKHRIEFPFTAQGNPSFTEPWLKIQDDANLRLVHEARKLEKHDGTFIQGTILGNAIADRIYCQFHALRTGDYGAVSGRFSSSNPNLQNIPTRDPILGPLLRSMFIADPDEIWWCDDWSQIEFRLLVHFALGRGADEARRLYNENPETDFHDMAAAITGIDRKPAKNINFGLVYGMGEPRMAYNMGTTLDLVKPLFATYHEKFPFVKRTYYEASNRASSRGYIKTLLGRRRRFNRWESSDWETSKNNNPVDSREAAIKLWGHVRRAETNKALNAVLQGSAADIMKKAMVDIYEAGICDILKFPELTVHDELNWSAPPTLQCRRAHREALHIMETCVKLRVPLRVSSNVGRNWDEAK